MVSDNSCISQPQPLSSSHSSFALDGRSAKGLFEHLVKLFVCLFVLFLLCSGEREITSSPHFILLQFYVIIT